MAKKAKKKGNKPKKLKKPKRKLTNAEKKARRERKKNFKTIFINGKQKRIKKEPMIDGLSADEFVAANADPIFLHQNEMWYLMENKPISEQTITDSEGS